VGKCGRRASGEGRGGWRWSCKYRELLISRVGVERESRGVHNRLQTKCQTTLCGRRWRAFRQGRPCLSFLAAASALPNFTVRTSYDPVGPNPFRVPVALPNFRPCCRSTVTSPHLIKYNGHSRHRYHMLLTSSIICSQEYNQ
jgi:hypothetical protein